LPSHKSANIEQRYEMPVRQLQQSLAQEQTRLYSERQSAKTRFLGQKQILEPQKAAAESNLRQQTLAVEKRFNDARKLIANDEQNARSHFQQSTDECQSRCRAAAALFAEESVQLTKDYKASLDRLNREIDGSARRVREASWRRDQATRRHSAFASLSFQQYALRALRKW
jgi:hypothetical protein